MTSSALLEKRYIVTMVNCSLIVMSSTITEVLQRLYCHPENHPFMASLFELQATCCFMLFYAMRDKEIYSYWVWWKILGLHFPSFLCTNLILIWFKLQIIFIEKFNPATYHDFCVLSYLINKMQLKEIYTKSGLHKNIYKSEMKS